MNLFECKKTNIVIISSRPFLTRLFEMVDLDHVSVVAFYCTNEDISQDYMAPFRSVFHPIEEFEKDCASYTDVYFICNIAWGISYNVIPEILKRNHVSRECCVSLEDAESNSETWYAYQVQWRYFEQHKPKLDFVVTGNSFTRYGISLPGLAPWQGIKLAAPSQDLYYGYQMAKAYLERCVASQGERPLKFCIIGLAPYMFQHKMTLRSANSTEILYFPILGHDAMEYVDAPKRNHIMRLLFHGRYRRSLEQYIAANRSKTYDVNDIDGMGRGMTKNMRVGFREKLQLKETLRIYGKTYPETVAFNIECLSKYVAMCMEYDVIPIAVLLPFAESAGGAQIYPQNTLHEFYDIIKSFLNPMHFIDLWQMKLPDSCFRDCTHLNDFGAVEVTKHIKHTVDTILATHGIHA